MSLLTILIAVLAWSGVVFIGTAAAWSWPRLAAFRIRPEMSRKVTGTKLWGRVLGNMALSMAMVFALTMLARPWLIDESASFSLLMVVAILFVYDGIYYCMHRWAFHVWPLKRVHAVHHVIRSPTAVESLYLHPLETFLGQLLLTAVGCMFGPVAPLTFGAALLVHSTLNITVHAGLDIPVLGLRTLSYLSRKHAIHHVSMRGGNYASLTPLWDKLLGTAE